MATETLSHKFKDYLAALTSTSLLYTNLGTTLIFGTNLFITFEKDYNATQVLTIIPYGGSPPSDEGDRQEGNIQIRLKTPSRSRLISTLQGLINTLHNNTAITTGRVVSNQSNPIVLGAIEGGEEVIGTINFTVKHIKI